LGTITWTNEAQRWLEDIFEYIAIDDRNAASQVVDDIKDSGDVEILGVFHGALDISKYSI